MIRLPHSVNGPCVTIRAWPIIHSNSPQTPKLQSLSLRSKRILQNISFSFESNNRQISLGLDRSNMILPSQLLLDEWPPPPKQTQFYKNNLIPVHIFVFMVLYVPILSRLTQNSCLCCKVPAGADINSNKVKKMVPSHSPYCALKWKKKRETLFTRETWSNVQEIIWTNPIRNRHRTDGYFQD